MSFCRTVLPGVLALLVLLAGCRKGPLASRSRARVAATKVNIAELDAAVNRFSLDVGRFPTQSEGFGALCQPPGGLAGWKGPYIKGNGVPLDAWSNPLVYSVTENGCEITSYGADGEKGGEGLDADISNVSAQSEGQ